MVGSGNQSVAYFGNGASSITKPNGKRYMTDPGIDLKIRVTARAAGFDMREDDFSIEITTAWGRVVRLLRKADTLVDAEGRFYFTLDNVGAGSYYATFTARLPDAGFADGHQELRVRHLLTIVGREWNGVPVCIPGGSPVLSVSYEAVWMDGSSAGVPLPYEPGESEPVGIVRIRYKVVEVSCDGYVTDCPPDGIETDVIYVNHTNDEHILTIASDGVQTPTGRDVILIVPSGGYAEANFANIGGTVYVRGV